MDIEIAEFAEDICCLLDDLGAKYTLHGKDNNEYSYLEENELSIRLLNPYVSHAIFINLQSELSIFLQIGTRITAMKKRIFPSFAKRLPQF